MAVLISDSDADWYEYERTKTILISIWRLIYGSKIRLRLRGLPRHETKTFGQSNSFHRFGTFRRRLSAEHVLEVSQ